MMGEAGKGVLAMVVACTVWGLSPIYYKQLAEVPPLEVLSHRTLWSFLIFSALLSYQKRLGDLFAVLVTMRGFLLIAAAGSLISLNWFVFIYSIQIDQAIAASFGYYVFPLVAVSIGYLGFGERLTNVQIVAVSLAVLAVLVLGFGLGVTPWISLVLAFSFGTYGLIKKSLTIGPVVSVTGEVALLLPLALIWLTGAHTAGWTGIEGRSGGFFGNDWFTTLLLVLAGLFTAGPLILFSFATKRLSMASVGFIQYLNPTLQFLVAVALFQEVFTLWHAIAFGFIWLALAIYSFSAYFQEKSA
ncbi:MAG: chloramphenicol-sensitive protein RarD [Paracoccaceae bacterium]|jgi:chloramphenicol-sensitive protein RarD